MIIITTVIAFQTTQDFVISVLDANDNAPVFEESEYRVLLQENTRLKHFAVNATDADASDNGIVRYSIAAGKLVK